MATPEPTTTNIFNSTDLVLDLDPTTIDRAWQTSNSIADNFSRWQSYLNQIALEVFLPWLQTEEDITAQALEPAIQNDLWQLVTGTAIAMTDAKLVLIPTEAEDKSELRVPQEWIDIPQWTADYYLAVQVSLDAGFVRLWGYGTHQKLKNGSFSISDRTYSLSDEQIITDLNALWVARELCPNEVTQAAVEPVAELDSNRAETLMQRLSSPDVVLPRLEVPFVTWAGLIQNPSWCRRLTAARNGATKTPILQWLQGIADIAPEFGWRQFELTANGAGARSVASGEVTAVPAVGLAKRIEIGDRPYELRILPLEEGAWRFELCCLTPGCMIPIGFKLRLLTEGFQGFEGNEDTATEAVSRLWIEVDLEPGESLIWQIEPIPNDYRQEVLQF